MTTPRFHGRILDALGPVLPDAGASDVAAHLRTLTATIVAPESLEDAPDQMRGFVYLANLAARLYSGIRIVASGPVKDACASAILAINPQCDIRDSSGTYDAGVSWAAFSSKHPSVLASGWNIVVNQETETEIASTNPLVSLAAASVAAGELFRQAFGQFLDKQRRDAGRYSLDLLGGGNASSPSLGSEIPLGTVHLAGAGAIGQALVTALASIPVTGELLVCDGERTTLSNLQRYVLTTDLDVDASKCTLAARALSGSKLAVRSYESTWATAAFDSVETVCTALDSSAARIAVQASLPRAIFNAWTQPVDLGWSRHERFGESPCLACLYWPRGQRPSQHEQIAAALRQPVLRILAYLVHRIPIDHPIREGQIPQVSGMIAPREAPEWLKRSLAEDVAKTIGVQVSELSGWNGRLVDELYREGICGGAIVGARVGELTSEVAVPLAHQSAFAGTMLALQLVLAKVPELARLRPAAPEGRLDLNAAPPRIALSPRQQTAGCICQDHDFIARYREKWPEFAAR